MSSQLLEYCITAGSSEVGKEEAPVMMKKLKAIERLLNFFYRNSDMSLGIM